MRPDVSVQICTCNRVEMALACLAALEEQTYPLDRFEVVLVDDGSSDERVGQIDPARYPFPLHVLRVPHGGLSKARNAGILAARADLVLFIDDDTLPDAHLVEEHRRAHEAEPHAVVLGWVNHVDPGRPPGETRRPRLADFSTSFLWTANASVRRADLLAAGLFDEAFAEYGWEDLELGERLRGLGLVRRFASRAVVSHLKRPWRGADVPRLLAQAQASGRTAVLFVQKQPTLRARLATGLSPWRMAANRLLEPAEGWYRRRVERAGDRRLRGVDWVAAYAWTRVAYFRAARAAMGIGGSEDPPCSTTRSPGPDRRV